jgi:serine/threonine protein kinase
LCDFTIITEVDPERKICESEGTPAFLAPEMNDMDNEDGFAPIPTDMWSLGVTMYTYFHEKLPFYAKEEMEMFEKSL